MKENTHHIVSPVSQYGGNVVDSIEDGTITDTQWAARLLLHHLEGKRTEKHLKTDWNLKLFLK